MPGTLMNDQYGGVTIEEALRTLAERKPSVGAVGITDYATTASFRRAFQAWSNGIGATILSLFPNVELRLDVPTTKQRGVNLHLIAAPSDVDQLDRFLALLEFSFGGTTYRAEAKSLIELGRAFKKDPSMGEDPALREGVTQFKVSFDQLKERYRASDWAKANCLIAVAGGEGDGTSGVRDQYGSFAARRQEIERFAHIIFSSNPNQRAFWLGRGTLTVEELESRYNGRKLCLHGSDAHELGRLGVPDEERYAWLKGNASFETLRQACIEPELRGWIGPEPPIAGNARGRICNLAVESPGWFAQKTVPVNPGLVAIIGPRGSGKTAFADILAAAAGSSSQFANRNSFLYRAGSLLNGSTATVEWTDDESTTCDLASPAETDTDPGSPAVRYLSQQFVEQLCASDGMSDELMDEIERVVFTSLPVGDRMEATSFPELLRLRLEPAKSRQDTELVGITDASEQITQNRLLKAGLAAKRRDLAERKKALTQLDKEAADLTAKADKLLASRLALVNAAVQKRDQELQRADRRLRSLLLLRQKTASAKTVDFPRFRAKLHEAHQEAGLDEDAWKSFEVRFVGDVDRILGALIKAAEGARVGIAGPDLTSAAQATINFDALRREELESKTVSELAAERTRLQTRAGIDQQRMRRLIANRDQAARETAKIGHLEAEIKDAEGSDARIADFTTIRLAHYAAYFDALLEEERELDTLYGPLSRIIKAAGDTVSKLRFSVRRTVDLARWAESGEALLDLRKDGAFRGRGELARVANERLVPVWTKGDARAAAQAIQQFSADFSQGLRLQSIVDPSDITRYRDWEMRVASWMYSADHVTLNYSLEYDGVDIRRLSPGLRGIVLLLLYLAVDQEEIVPLIIDQPEENLDPESVYLELVKLFRQASDRRQVIMVTHNANLVVNTDVDQVVVASCGPLQPGQLPELRYLSGGLEEQTIRDAVCQILEGGEQAFRDRARRLRLRW